MNILEVVGKPMSTLADVEDLVECGITHPKCSLLIHLTSEEDGSIAPDTGRCLDKMCDLQVPFVIVVMLLNALGSCRVSVSTLADEETGKTHEERCRQQGAHPPIRRRRRSVEHNGERSPMRHTGSV